MKSLYCVEIVISSQIRLTALIIEECRSYYRNIKLYATLFYHY